MHPTLKTALNTFGAYAQTVVAIEELSELQKELCKAIRTGIGDPENRDHIAEEIADVYIMLEQMEALFDVSEDVPLYRIAKIDRLGNNLPVSIGDHVYFIRDHENQKRIAFGTIKEIFFSQDMRLMIRVKGYRAAEWGVKAFRTRKEAETAIGNTVWESASDAQKNATAVYNAMVEYVRNALTESKESQKKLADRAGVSQGTVTSFLSGGRSVGTNLTLALLEASGIDTFDMFYTYVDKKEEETA